MKVPTASAQQEGSEEKRKTSAESVQENEDGLEAA